MIMRGSCTIEGATFAALRGDIWPKPPRTLSNSPGTSFQRTSRRIAFSPDEARKVDALAAAVDQCRAGWRPDEPGTAPPTAASRSPPGLSPARTGTGHAPSPARENPAGTESSPMRRRARPAVKLKPGVRASTGPCAPAMRAGDAALTRRASLGGRALLGGSGLARGGLKAPASPRPSAAPASSR